MNFEWISLEDSEPRKIFKHHEPGPEVLCCCPDGLKIGRQWQSGKFTDNHLYDIEGITHWMYLPDLPMKPAFPKMCTLFKDAYKNTLSFHESIEAFNKNMEILKVWMSAQDTQNSLFLHRISRLEEKYRGFSLKSEIWKF